jgi:glycosyltransferase involved in cell wall biosynthesis
MPGVEPSRSWVVIPAYNEEGAIGEVVSEVVKAGGHVVVVDDGSKDGTAARAKSAGVTVLRHATNLGQGAALQTGIDYAVKQGAQAVVTFDADGQHQAEDIHKLLEALEDADVALGSRHLGSVEGASRARKKLLAIATRVSNMMSGLSLTDAHCGMRAIRVSALPGLRIQQDRMAHASELLRKIRTSRLRVTEVPIRVKYTPYSMKKGQGGFQAVRILFDYYFRR